MTSKKKFSLFLMVKDFSKDVSGFGFVHQFPQGKNSTEAYIYVVV